MRAQKKIPNMTENWCSNLSMLLPNPKRDAIRTRSRSCDVAKTFPNKPLRNLKYFEFAPDNHIYRCNVFQVCTKFMKQSFRWLAKVYISNTTGLEWVRRCVMSSIVFHQPPLPTGAARYFLFSQISSEMRLLIVAN